MTSGDVAGQIEALTSAAKGAARSLRGLDRAAKDAALKAMAAALREAKTRIKAANADDLEAGREAGLSAALLDRLELTDARFEAMVSGVDEIAELDDPIGRVLETRPHQTGFMLEKRAVPIGVIGIIYESRPNVTADAAALCFKAGNAVILRGGREARRSNAAIADALGAGLDAAGAPQAAIQLVRTTDRDAVRALVQAVGSLDLVIPRGGEGLIQAVTEQARVPVIKHYKGVCHVYVDGSADPEMALAICENAKCQRPGVCNAMETLLVDAAIAETFLPQLEQRLSSVELRGDARVCEVVPRAVPAKASDWDDEYLDLILAVRVVEGVDAAVEHIARHGSQHSDAIVAADEAAQRAFVAGVDSAAVYVNVSTRFTDGAEFGMGAEIGISTDKLHARGPMGLVELTTYSWIARGNGQVR
ncbi:MAG: glutamate-5-semialdehyde dehydrogenase [Proteobacteria bacterium]|nr:MAG: glutamate-5-semialdehyde dehydrogenase [Pseudomonadota bacterium]